MNRLAAVIALAAAGLAVVAAVIVMRMDAPEPGVAPAGATAPPPVVGTLRIASDVAGAQVFIDRQFVGAAPVVAENVTPGSHQLNVSAAGFDSIATAIDVVPGEHEIVVKLREVHLRDSRQGMNTQCRLPDLLRPSVYSRLAGYEDLNDAVRLAADPTFRLLGSPTRWDRSGGAHLHVALVRDRAADP